MILEYTGYLRVRYVSVQYMHACTHARTSTHLNGARAMQSMHLYII